MEGYGMALAKTLGGLRDAAIWGTNKKASYGGAAFANSELINALDYEPLLFSTHASPSLIPASLTLKKSKGSFRERPFLVAPAAYLSMGGVEIDEKGKTRLPGLFAAREAVWGIHGANRGATL